MLRPSALHTPTWSRRGALKGLAGGAAFAAGGRASAAAAATRSETLVDEPKPVRAIYLNPRVTESWDGFMELVDLIDRTELNALVIDIKDDQVFYPTDVSLFRESGTVAPLYDVSAMLAVLADHRIFSIARLVVFKDPLVAEMRPDLGVLDTETGALWRDMNGIAWVNPLAEELWEANASLAVEAGRLGFDEIQYDYVRFPTDGDLSRMDFGTPLAEETRTNAIVSFAEMSFNQLAPTGAKLAADIFGYTLLVPGDLGIGQNADRLAPFFDTLCPMVYPSHFPEGSLLVPGHPNDYPYETIRISMEAGASKVGGQTRKLRPWLQDFSLPGMTPYTITDVRAQIDAAEATNTGGWLLWNPDNVYAEETFRAAG
ncbi:MAG: putative glycoside hydrolase [Thermomicrobiales bacterium]